MAGSTKLKPDRGEASVADMKNLESNKSDKPTKTEKLSKAEKRAQSEKSSKSETKSTKSSGSILPSPCMSGRIQDNVSFILTILQTRIQIIWIRLTQRC